jgi:FAD/FMN-containing dehydrogenase
MSTTQVTPGSEAVREFAARVRGAVIHPGDADYDDARAVWNGLIDRKPALIVRPIGTADVIQAVNFARESGMVLSAAGDTTWPVMRSTTTES